MEGLLELYSWRYPRFLAALLAQQHNRAGAFLRAFWTNRRFSMATTAPASGFVAAVLWILLIIELGVGIWLVVQGIQQEITGGVAFGAALIVAYPLVLAHLLALSVAVASVLRVKAWGKALLCAVMSRQVVRLRQRHGFKVVAVAGSVGKTSTKIAIARLLQASQRVQWQEGNYNDPVTVPLIFFGHSQPAIWNAFAWLRIIVANERAIRRPYPYDVVVAELGTDTPGTIPQFAYVHPDIAVVTAVTPEHMEYFGTLEEVAKEELAVFDFAQQVLVNVDDTPAEFLQERDFASYSLKKGTYTASPQESKGWHGQKVAFKLDTYTLTEHISLLGEQGAKITLAALATAHLLGVDKQAISKGIPNIAAYAGRMQVLPGIKNSTVIDDTYNATPVAAKAALDVLYAGKAPQCIAILGSMNELGEYSQQAHQEVGAYCDPRKLDWVVTIGDYANRFLAPAAEQRGCQVQQCVSPYEAGQFVQEQLQEDAVVLAKGSQNKVFAEEAIKPLLADPKDVSKLVRQSPSWMAIKKKQFSS